MHLPGREHSDAHRVSATGIDIDWPDVCCTLSLLPAGCIHLLKADLMRFETHQRFVSRLERSAFVGECKPRQHAPSAPER